MEATSIDASCWVGALQVHTWLEAVLQTYMIDLGNDFAGLALRTVIDILTDNDDRLTSASFSYRISTN